MSLSSAGLDPRRRRILFRARRRGLREMDVALGGFADAHLTDLTEAELDEVEAWLDLPDPEILSWLTGEAPAPPRFDTPLFAKLKAAADRMNAPVAAATRLRQPTAITLARAPEGFDAFVVADLVRALARDAERRAVALTFLARDSVRAQSFIEALAFAAPEIEALVLPAWDCQPYDRVSPNAAVAAAAHDRARPPRADRAARASGRASWSRPSTR